MWPIRDAILREGVRQCKCQRPFCKYRANCHVISIWESTRIRRHAQPGTPKQIFLKPDARSSGNLFFEEASKLAAELQHPPSSLTERRGVGGMGRRGVCPLLGQRIGSSPNLKK